MNSINTAHEVQVLETNAEQEDVLALTTEQLALIAGGEVITNSI